MKSFLKFLVAIALLVGISDMPARAQDGVNPQIANCEELTDPDTRFQAELCSAHLGCRLVFAIHRACTSAKSFLGRLGSRLNGRRDINNNDVFYADMPAMPSSSYSGSRLSIWMQKLRASVSELFNGKKQEGFMLNDTYYEGSFNRSTGTGTGVAIGKDRSMRGSFVNGQPDGLAQVKRDDTLLTGQYARGNLHGDGTALLKDGSVVEGRWANGKPVGQMQMTRADGTRTTLTATLSGGPPAAKPVAGQPSIVKQSPPISTRAPASVSSKAPAPAASSQKPAGSSGNTGQTFCFPGPQYDAHRCQCWTYPRTPGCSPR
nr:hypothetical protein [Sphingomonas sp. Y57]